MRRREMVLRGWVLAWAILVARIGVFAQTADGNQGINQANTMIRSYFDTGTNLMYAVGAILGLVGAIRVYSLWIQGDPHTTKVATAWFSACIFLVVVATVIKAFYGM